MTTFLSVYFAFKKLEPYDGAAPSPPGWKPGIPSCYTNTTLMWIFLNLIILIIKSWLYYIAIIVSTQSIFIFLLLLFAFTDIQCLLTTNNLARGQVLPPLVASANATPYSGDHSWT